jgi:ribosome-interacting GTPase 1
LFAQVEHDQYLHHEKEKLLKTEEADAAEKLNNLLKARVAELEANLEKHMAEKLELQARVEKATLSSGRICGF